MKTRWANRVKIGLCGSLALILLLVSASIARTYYLRWQASKLLAVVRTLYPGVTSEAQAREALKPFVKFESHSGRDQYDSSASTVDYTFYRFSKPEQAVVAFSLDWLHFCPFFLRWTLFEVDLQFSQGYLSKVGVSEMQEVSLGEVHVHAATVDIVSRRFEEGRDVLDDGFENHTVRGRNWAVPIFRGRTLNTMKLGQSSCLGSSSGWTSVRHLSNELRR
jgi:hypothetical protein